MPAATSSTSSPTRPDGHVSRPSASSSEEFETTTFPNDAGYDELVVMCDIEFTALCEHHLLPFRGVAQVDYLPGDRIIGLSKLAKLVGHFAADHRSRND